MLRARRSEALGSEHFKLIVRRSSRALPAISVPKAVEKRATARNYMRRVVRQVLRNKEFKLETGLVIVVRKPFRRGQGRICQEELATLLSAHSCEQQ